MQTYEELLKSALEKTSKTGTGERFEMPKLEVFFQGRQTIVKNFVDAANKIRRPPEHILKFLTKELATPCSSDSQRAVFQSKLSSMLIQKKFESYVKDFVICSACGRPDTKLVKEDRIEFIKCEACGAKNSAKI